MLQRGALLNLKNKLAVLSMKRFKSRKELVVTSIFILVVSGLMVGFFYTTFYERLFLKDAIKKNMEIYQGAKILKASRLPKFNDVYIVKFMFSVQGKDYKSEIKNSYNFKTSASFRERSFPVACERNNLSNAFILLKPEDFKEFGQEFPDSLNWIKEELLK
jgi:hypothetical protein